MDNTFEDIQCCIDEDNINLAQEKILQELEKAPDSAVLHALLALCFMSSRGYNHELATQEVNKAMELDSELSDTRYALGCLLFHERKFTNAEGELRRAIELDPNRVNTYSSLQSCTV